VTPAERREQIELSLIRYLAENPMRFGTPVGVLVAQLRCEFHPHPDSEEATERLEYMADATNALGKPIVTQVAKLSPDLSRWKLTAAGSEHAHSLGYERKQS
jgi:hypothetical protein